VTRMNPPYLRIVEDIRRQISTGDLRPGDRVPSARRITQQWGVAIATATKVLATLQQEGLVRVVPGVGTVVSPAGPTTPPPRTPKRRQNTREPQPELSRDRIVRAAIEIADTEGMAALSMRRVATDLDAATMSLYRYVHSKDDLVLFMIDQAIGEEALPETPPEGWRARLQVTARLQWRLFRRHRWLAAAMSLTRPQLAPNALAHAEWVLRALEGFDLDPSAIMHTHVMLFSYVRGLATSLEAEAEAERDTGMTSDEWMETQEAALDAVAGSGSFATFLRIVKESDFDFDLDTLFEFGLMRMLDGLAVYLATVRFVGCRARTRIVKENDDRDGPGRAGPAPGR
jgi:DNA-binding transcriptional regulator YhcF (GntR family)